MRSNDDPEQYKNNIRKFLHNEKGFSLVELIVVIAIMVVLITQLAPQVVVYIKKAQKAADMEAAAVIGNAAAMAMADKPAYDSFIKAASTGSSVNTSGAAGGALNDTGTVKVACVSQCVLGQYNPAGTDRKFTNWQGDAETPRSKKGWIVNFKNSQSEGAVFTDAFRQVLGEEKDCTLSYWAKVTDKYPSRNPDSQIRTGTVCDRFIVVGEWKSPYPQVWIGFRGSGSDIPVYEIWPDPDPIYFDAMG